MKFIIGKKVGMSRVFKGDKMIPVTLVMADKCYVAQIKTAEKDGYNAVQIGTGRKRKITKPERGHIDKAGKNLENLKNIFEFRVDKTDDFKLGQEIDVSIFSEGEIVKASGLSKGKGFTGVVKRHGFSGAPATHGHRHDERAPGSIGAAFPEHVFKGIKMAGRHGNSKVTVKNLEIVELDKDRNIIALKGSLPGARNNLIGITSIS